MRPPEMGKPARGAAWGGGRRKLRSVNLPKRLWGEAGGEGD